MEVLGEEAIPNLIRVLSIPGRFLWNTFVRLPLIHLLGLPRLQAIRAETGGQSERDGLPLEGGQQSEQEDSVIHDRLSNRKTVFMGIGTAGQRFAVRWRQALDDLHGTANLAAEGTLNLKQLSEAPESVDSRGGVLNISTVRSEVQLASAQSSQQEKVWSLLLHALAERVATIYSNLGLQEEGQIGVVLDTDVAHKCADPLRELAKRLPGHLIFVVAFLPGTQSYDKQVQAGLATLAQLKEEGVVTAVLLVDPRSPLAREAGGERQELLLAKGLASLVVAHAHDQRNPTFAEELQRLGRHGRFVVGAFGSLSVINGRPLRWFQAISHSKNDDSKGFGRLSDAKRRARDLTEQLLVDERARTARIPLGVEASPSSLAYTVPIRLTDLRFRKFREDLEPWATEQAPIAVPAFVQGNGVRDGRLTGQYFVQVSLFYAIDPVMWVEGELEPEQPAAPFRTNGGGGELMPKDTPKPSGRNGRVSRKVPTHVS